MTAYQNLFWGQNYVGVFPYHAEGFYLIDYEDKPKDYLIRGGYLDSTARFVDSSARLQKNNTLLGWLISSERND